MRLNDLLVAIATGGLAACSTPVIVSDVTAERTATGEIVVAFHADQDLEETGLSVLGYFSIPPNPGAERRPMSTCCAVLYPQPGSSGNRYPYICRIPAKADQAGDIYGRNPQGNLGFVAVVHIPYDFRGPGDTTLEFCVLGGGCGFRGLESNTVTLTLRGP